MSERSRILVVFPTTWDARQLEACHAAWAGAYEVELASPTDADCPDDLDIHEFVEARLADATRAPWAGVTSSSDYPGAAVAAVLAARLGLAGARPDAVLRAAHKYYARLVQRDAVPDAVPEFALLDPAKSVATARMLPFPCYVKPVKGAFSVLSKRCTSLDDLAALFARPCVQGYTQHTLRIFDALLARYASCALDARYFIAEEPLRGVQVTVEGWVQNGTVELLGIVDSVMHPGTRSFSRFEYPSALPPHAQERLFDVARRAVLAHGLDHTLFNVEMTWDADRERAGIIEINPRLCGQFADLYQKVDGTNTWEIALALAAGRSPRMQRGAGPHRFAASVPLRTFEPVRFERVPGSADVHAAEALFPGTLIWLECEAGQEFRDFVSGEDGCSARYAVVNLGAADRDAALERFEAVRSRLGFAFAPIETLVATPR